VLTALGYSVTRNSPYAGGFTTRRYGHPENGVHALQIEVNRALYMDEKTLEPHGDGASLREDLNSLVRQIATATPLARAAE
jgi:N-formylglutamate amidohydrolase